MNIVSEKNKIQTHLDKANYHAAINVAISAMNACRHNEDQAGVDEFLDIVQGIVQTMNDEYRTRPQ